MRRREFILAGGATVVSPFVSRAEQADHTRRLGYHTMPDNIGRNAAWSDQSRAKPWPLA
jgi:hypothetical protein